MKKGMDSMKYKETLIIFGIVILFLPIFFERIYDDEAIYWSLSNSIIANGLSEVAYIGRMPFAMLLASLFMNLNDSIFVPRILSALFAIGSSIIIFEISKIYSNEKAAFISSILFIFSFQAIRFGTRFYLDIYGVFFFLLSVYLIKKNKIGISGLSFALAILSRETWVGLYPFMILYLWKNKKPVGSFIIQSFIPILIFFVPIQMTTGVVDYLGRSAFAQDTSYLSENLYQIPLYLAQSWIEFSVIHIITLLGFISWIFYKRDDLLIIILPQFLLLSLIQGFIYNGALTQYAMGIQASMALFAGPGLFILWKKYFRSYPLQLSITLILVIQLLLFSYLATSLSLRGSLGVHDFGYWYDEEVITLLNQKAGNETIAGFHGAFIKGAKEWVWYERNVDEVLSMEPDWYIIVEPKLIDFKTDPENTKQVEVYNIGPYIILHSHPPGHMHELIEPSKEFKKWMFRS